MDSFFNPQAPGGCIRALGYPRYAAGARSRLPPLCVGSALPLVVSF